MTALRPEREGAAFAAQEPDVYTPYEPYGTRDAVAGYEHSDAFAVAVERLDDPLSDPLPQGDPAAGTPGASAAEGSGRRRRARHSRPGALDEEAVRDGGPAGGRGSGPASGGQPGVPSDRGAPYGPGAATGHGSASGVSGTSVRAGRRRAAGPTAEPSDPAPGLPRSQPPRDDETVALRKVELPPPARRRPAEAGERAGDDPDEDALGADESDGAGPPAGGRAARRKAAQEAARRGGGRRHGRGSRAAEAVAGPSGAADQSAGLAAPLTRIEARRAARARKDSPAVVVSRVIGELFITIGVLMLLFVTYQLWWTNVLAHQQANGTTNNLHKQWDKGGDRAPGAFSPGEGFAVIYIPKLDVKAPIAEGISKTKVLDHGMVGHYAEGSLKTAMPWDKQGNFALAGHRNTHGEPFRYINQLDPGDKIIVETQNSFFTYEMTSILPVTPPSNTSVIQPVPAGSGFTKPGRYITLTTCTPEFTSTNRMIVWGKLVDEQPRSEGKPDALVG